VNFRGGEAEAVLYYFPRVSINNIILIARLLFNSMLCIHLFFLSEAERSEEPDKGGCDEASAEWSDLD